MTYIFFWINKRFHNDLAHNGAPTLRKRVVLFAGTKAEIWNSALVSTRFYLAGNPLSAAAYVNSK